MNEYYFHNPFRPGAGHMPPHLAGREKETGEFKRILDQNVILENFLLTGLRGVGKTVLLDTLKPLAIQIGWLWAGTDISESSSVTEEIMAQRLIVDLAVVTSNIIIGSNETKKIGFLSKEEVHHKKLDYEVLTAIYKSTPGLVSDKLKGLLQTVWEIIKPLNTRGIIFAYDEAQTMSDHSEKEQYPLSLLLDIFQSIQKKNIPFMLVLTGLPTLFPKLVETRTYSERMFRVVVLNRLNENESKEAILKPIEDAKCPIKFNEASINMIIKGSDGYPYSIQFICREVFDIFLQKLKRGEKPSAPIEEITRKLDQDFFAGRWAKVTDRQKDLLCVIASLESCHEEFTVQEIVEKSLKILDKSFSNSHVNQMLSLLVESGLIYKNRHGKYSFAVPLLGK